MPPRKIVCGSRSTYDYAFVCRELDAIYSEEQFDLFVGFNRESAVFQGVDELACRWADQNGIPVQCFPANWKKHGRGAGPIRNAQMARSGAVECIAFPGGTGTANMVRQASEMGLKVRTITRL